MSEILSISDPKNHNSIVQNVFPREELFIGEKVSEFPDLIYFLHPDYEAGIEGGFDLFAKSLISANPYPSGRGNHNVDGIYIFYGKNIPAKGEIEKKSIMDILPTVLFYLDVPIPDDLDGSPILDIFNKDFVHGKKPQYMPIKPLSYQELKSKEETQSFDAQDSIAEKLKNLGYL